MEVGFILPGGSTSEQVALGVLAEESGWDGVFVWEAGYGVDAWALLAALAVRTHQTDLGTLLTPLPWRRPWKLASQVATIDQLAPGRVILTLGLGALTEDLPRTGEIEDLRERATLLDDGIDLMHALWSGSTSFEGTRYHYTFDRDDQVRLMRPARGSIRVWVVAAWPRLKSMRRVLRVSGVVPQFADDGGGPADAHNVRQWLLAHGASPDADVIAQGQTVPGRSAEDEVAAWATAGCTWWLETNWEMPHHSAARMRQVKERLAAGPPRPG